MRDRMVSSVCITLIQANNLIVDDPFTWPVGNVSVSGCLGLSSVISAKETPDADGEGCKGDSGGPVVADLDRDGVWVQYGLVSFGTGPEGFILCGQATYSCFTDVSQWTDKVISLVEENQ